RSHIAVEDRDVVIPARAQSKVAYCAKLIAVVLLADVPDIQQSLVATNDTQDVFATAVVRHNNFERMACLLRRQAGKRDVKQSAPVEGRSDDAETAPPP